MSDERRDDTGDPGELKAAFLRAAPRRIVEIKAALGALIADPASTRMRDEFRRRLQSVYALARGHELASLADGLRLLLDQVDTTRALNALSRAHLDRLAALVASLNGRLDLDVRGPSSQPPRPEGISSPRPPPLPGADATIPGVDPLARSLVLGRGAMRPAPGSVPLPGAAAQVVVGIAPARANALLEALPTDVEVHVATDHDEVLRRARETSAELVIVESGPPWDGVAVLAALRADARADFVPVAIVAAAEESVTALRARSSGAFEVLPDDADTDALKSLVDRALRGGITMPPPPVTDLRAANIEELSRALQDEIHRGLVASADPATRGTRVPLGEGSEVLAAAWRAITAIRDLVEQRSHGAVRFDVPVAPRGLPGAEVLSVGVEPTDESAWVAPGEDPLPGRRALVVDDDPKVVAQFAQTLKGAGMNVITRTDGRAALEVARAMRPDVVLADILMPGMDGFALCRAIRRDVLLRHTPVILLSWKEDLLVRMRELGAQAQGYLRKEARIEAVVARVRATLRLRARTQKRIAELPWGAEVRGRVERVGLPTLLEAAAGIDDATVTLGDSVSVTELELRKGRLVAATRTAQDGSVVRGEEALARAVAAPAARFGVRRASSNPRANLDGTVAELLRGAARRVAAVEDALVGAGLLQVARVVFDDDVAAAYARALPAPMRALVERIVGGEGPRDLVLRDGVAPSELEPLLVELARRGAVRQVLGADGVDLAALRLASPESVAPPAAESAPSAPPEAPREALSVEPAASPRPPPPADDMEFELGESLADAVFRQLTQTVGARETKGSPIRGPTPPFGTPASLVQHDASRIEPMEILPLAAKIFDSAPPSAPPMPSSEPPPPTTDLGPPQEPDALEEPPPLPPRHSDPAPLDAPRDPSLPSVRAPSMSERADAPAVELPAPPAVPAEALEAPRDEAPEEPSSAPPPPPPRSIPAQPQGRRAVLSLARLAERAEEEGIAGSLGASPEPSEGPKEAPVASSEPSKGPEEAPVASSEPSKGPEEAPVASPKPSEGPEEAPAASPKPVERAEVEGSETSTGASKGSDERSGASAKPDADLSARRGYAAPLRAPPEDRDGVSGLGRTLRLVVLVIVAAAVSYVAVRVLVGRRARVEPETTETPAPVTVPRPAVNADAGDTAQRLADAGADYVDPGPFLDGGALPEGSGLLVVPRPRAGTPRVTVVVEHIGSYEAPAVITLPEDVYRVRFETGRIRSVQFATVRRGWAVVRQPPSER